jgi:phage shock protein C
MITETQVAYGGDMKKLYRSRSSKVIAGVCGGIAEHFDSDPVLIRIIAILFLLSAPPAAFIAYIVCLVIIPFEPLEFFFKEKSSPIEAPNDTASQQTPPPTSSPSPFDLFMQQKQGTGNTANLIIGVILIVLGAGFFMSNFHSVWTHFWSFWGWGWHFFAPSVLIAVGLIIILFHARK